MVVKFANFGESLGTRTIGKPIREKVTKTLNESDFVEFDFDAVKVISNSFADEVFGKLLLEFDLDLIKKRTTFTNANKLVSSIILKAINDRKRLKEKEEIMV